MKLDFVRSSGEKKYNHQIQIVSWAFTLNVICEPLMIDCVFLNYCQVILNSLNNHVFAKLFPINLLCYRVE